VRSDGDEELSSKAEENTAVNDIEAGKDIKLNLNGTKVFCTPVSVGNPHAILFVDAIDEVPVAELGPVIEKNAVFPGGVNVEFVQVISEQELRMRVWERGSGITMACGTGACAAVAAAIQKGYCHFRTPVSVRLDGGVLEIQITKDHSVTMSGPAETVFEGDVL
jgi:diaminopimelate epimerase